MALENQIKYVGMALIELEEQLARDTVILDKPGAIQDHIRMLEVRGRKAILLISFILVPLYSF